MNQTMYCTYLTTPQPVGQLEIIASEKGLVAVLWRDDERWDFRHSKLEANVITEQTEQQLKEYFAGDRRDFDLPLDLRGTDFQKMVWESLATIPFGETVSYAEQAARLGRPTAVRAVASANGSNPVSIILPCHRVVGSNGKLTGYAGGLAAKRFLLEHEGAIEPSLF